METKSFCWWLKSSKSDTHLSKSTEKDSALPSSPRIDEDISSSLAEFIQKESDLQKLSAAEKDDVDIGSIIEEIDRLAAQSPLGPYEKNIADRSVEDIMKEAERLYIESSKSFEQLSIHSRTSQNISEMQLDNSEVSTPTPKSVSPLPEDSDPNKNDSYSDDFSDDKSEGPITDVGDKNKNSAEKRTTTTSPIIRAENVSNVVHSNSSPESLGYEEAVKSSSNEDKSLLFPINADQEDELGRYKEDMRKKEGVIKMLIEDNRRLKENIDVMKVQLDSTSGFLSDSAKPNFALKSPELNLELDKALENLKDTQEVNTALQLQLDSLNKTHQTLKTSYEDLLVTNKSLERRLADTESLLDKHKSELVTVKEQNFKLTESEANLNKLLGIERLHAKSLKTQTEKDARCILDLNRQIKEMERIIARKHPDSVSALIVASKNDLSDSNMSARRVLEDRIKNLEQEAASRDTQSSQIFLEVQEKFNQMKNKYESHIEDLELHVNDLKEQLKRRSDTYDVYTQTTSSEQKYPQKETISKACQATFVKTEPALKPKGTAATNRRTDKLEKEETHLLATIRGLQTDLANKEKVVSKLQREIDELRKTNRRLQKEREGSLKSLSDKREIHSYPEKLAQHANEELANIDSQLLDELKVVKSDRDKMKLQLCRIEDDYQQLKTKRLQDLTALQEAHEREIAAYLSNITPLREQLEIQQVTISTLQSQLRETKEELAIMTVEKEHLTNKLKCGGNIMNLEHALNGNANEDALSLRKKMAYLEAKHEEREQRLRAIVHGLAQKNVTNRSCEQCSARQQQLIGYKAELDQLLATLRSLQ